jgi:ribonuclease P protein subunit POP4
MKKQYIGMNIGKLIEIIDSKNKTLIGIKGKVIDETKNTLTIQTKSRIIKIIKTQVKIENES